MEQRRIILFLSLSFVVLVLNSMMLTRPETSPPENPQQAATLADAEEVQSPEDATDQATAAEQASPPEHEAPDNTAAQSDPELDDGLTRAEVPLSYVSLGSVDPASPFRGLWTLTNQGAAVRRVELASPRFRDLHDRGGYIGHLELKVAPEGGLLVQSVGAGTPADRAGMTRGDRITRAQAGPTSVDLKTAKQFAEFLSDLKPEGEISLDVSRDDGKTDSLNLTLGRRPLEVIRPESENMRLRDQQIPADYTDTPSFRFTLTSLGASPSASSVSELPGVDLLDSNWEIAEQSQTQVRFRQTVPAQGIEVTKTYRIEPIPAEQLQDEYYPAYSLQLEIEVRNLGEEAKSLVYRLDGPNGLPVEGWWYARKFGRHWGAAGLRDVVGRYFGSDTAEVSPSKIAEEEAESFEGGSMAFIGVDAQYFSSVVLPHKMSPDEIWLDVVHPVLLGPAPRQRSNEAMFANATCQLISRQFSLSAGESLKHSYTVFAGPKRPDLLANYHAVNSEQYSLYDLLYYGWFSGVAKLMLGFLHFFYGLIGNYGVAIVVLTVFVKSCMVPLTRKQMQSMAKMQQLKPELENIKQKYKSDPQKQSQAMQELYRKHNINPLAGCLPMFIQLPIFVGLYRSLAVDVELRQAPLISESIRWCSNLAAPDMLFDWSRIMPSFITSGEGLFGFGPYFNLLPILTAVLFIVQQKITMPPPADEQAAMQQKMMQYMMIFFGLMFYKVAAGLCIYFIASSLWGLAERKLWPVPAMNTGSAIAPAPSSSKPAKNGESSTKKRRSKKKR